MQPIQTEPMPRIEVPTALDASVAVDGALLLRWSLKNEGDRTIFVFDRPVARGARGEPIDDPDAPYRFVRDQRLRVLIGDSPLPRFSSVTTHAYPRATPLAPGASIRRSQRVALPAMEHSAYWSLGAIRKRPHASPPPFEEARVAMVDLLVDYVADRPGLAATQAELEGAVRFATMGDVYAAVVRLHRAMPIEGVVALRRVHLDARPRLPHEEDEPLPTLPEPPPETHE